MTTEQIELALNLEEPSYEFYRDNCDMAVNDVDFWRRAARFLMEREDQRPNKAYLLDAGERISLIFAKDAVKAGEKLVELTGCDFDSISVAGNYDVDPDKPIDLSILWSYFTNNPPERHVTDNKHKPVE